MLQRTSVSWDQMSHKQGLKINRKWRIKHNIFYIICNINQILINYYYYYYYFKNNDKKLERAWSTQNLREKVAHVVKEWLSLSFSLTPT